MKNSEKLLQALFDKATKKTVFASFYSLRSVDLANEETFTDFVLDLREEDMFGLLKQSDVNMEEVKNMAIASYKKSTDELLEKLSKALELAIDENKVFTRKEKDKKK